MEYIRPLNLKQALETKLHYGKDAAVLAGGTDLLIRIRAKKEAPKALLDLEKVDLNYINIEPAKLKIGAMTTLRRIILDESLKYYPIIAETAKEVGAQQTRTLATLGGNICTGIPSADMALPLLVLEASLVIKSMDETKIISLEDFFHGPREIALDDNEILTEINIPRIVPSGCKGYAFLKIGKRKAMRLSIASIALNLDIDPENKIINDIKIAMGTLAPVPIRLKNVEKLMIRNKLEEKLVNEAADAVIDNISPRTSLRASKEYRTHLAKVLFIRALNIAEQRALGGDSNGC